MTVISHNNIGDGRYRRAIESILAQNYSNYQLVFIDDNSDDGTLKATRDLLEAKRFPKDKLTIVQNL